ncbi:MAG: L-serine ammonia-lyase, iron-sulfur-dependent, subunit alpha [Peptostreptococcaceae bacterium]|nr:L-serine ammonia-lyase, iron-sulfur-dependent, subunit alpha [Peptostreptococcaceae bacterium]
MDYGFRNGKELIDLCRTHEKNMGQIMILREMEISGRSMEYIRGEMKEKLEIMRAAAEKGIENEIKSVGGLIGGEARKLNDWNKKDKSISGTVMNKAVARALSVMEVNASMGHIVAAPTAGSCGILPGVIITAGETLESTEDEHIDGLFAASAVGLLVMQNATVSGAEGGCQAETGTAAAMASAGVVQMAGGTPEMSLHAGAMTFKNVMGLICDPIAGLVESPCQKRNALGVANAMVSADMALSGIESLIPFDEVVEAMLRVGKALPATFRETAMGGLATTPTGIKISKELYAPKI